MAVLLTQLLVGEFSQKITKNGRNFLFFGCNFFCVKDREKFLRSTDRNMVFPQILSHMYAIIFRPVVTEI